MGSISDDFKADARLTYGSQADTMSVADAVRYATERISGVTTGSVSDRVVNYSIPTRPGAGPTRMTVAL